MTTKRLKPTESMFYDNKQTPLKALLFFSRDSKCKGSRSKKINFVVGNKAQKHFLIQLKEKQIQIFVNVCVYFQVCAYY